ncbi:MAG: twitching motility protein PilT [bacterium]|nr:twitching motility protein PilT [bacterium]
MRKLRIYLDTSVISYLDQQDSPEKMRQTQELWKILKMGKYEIVISSLVIEEIDKCEEYKKDLLYYYLSQINCIK